jgi:hypothetical protein
MAIATQQEREATAHDHSTGTPPGNQQSQVLRVRKAHPKRSKTKSPANWQLIYRNGPVAHGAESRQSQSVTHTCLGAEHFACGIVSVSTLRREQLDDSPQHILATSADFFKRFQSPAAIGASEAGEAPCDGPRSPRVTCVLFPVSLHSALMKSGLDHAKSSESMEHVPGSSWAAKIRPTRRPIAQREETLWGR